MGSMWPSQRLTSVREETVKVMNYLVSEREGGGRRLGGANVLTVQRRRELQTSTFIDCWFDGRSGCVRESA